MTNSSDGKWLAYAQVIAAHVVDGAPLPANFATPDALLFCKKNALLYAVGSALASQRPFTPKAEAAMQKATHQAAGTVALLDMLLPRFEQAGLPFFTMKTFLPFPYVDSNIDIFCVPPHAWVDYVAELRDAGFGWFKNLADVREPMKRTYIFRDKQAFPAVHLHAAVSWNGVVYLDLDAVWQHRVTMRVAGHDIAVPCPTDEALIMMAHALFENKFITLHELLYLALLCRQGIDWELARRAAARFGWLPGFETMLALHAALAQEVGLDAALPVENVTVSLPLEWHLPYLLPLSLTLPVCRAKLVHDVIAGRWRRVPRQLFSYTVVDPLWMMRKARKACRLETPA